MIGPRMPSEFTRHAELIRRVGRLRAALEAATRDNAHLPRELAAARAENRRLREQGNEDAALRRREERLR